MIKKDDTFKIFQEQPAFIEDSMAPWTELLEEDYHVKVFRDIYPVTEGHLLFVPKYNTVSVLMDCFEDAIRDGIERVRRGEWDKALKLWKPNDLPLKSLIDSIGRRGIDTAVVTFLPEEAVEPIYRWLIRKGVSCTVNSYDSPEHYESDLRYDRGIKVVYVPSKEIAYVLGMRATVVSPASAWSL